jgi:hypothetical protein
MSKNRHHGLTPAQLDPRNAIPGGPQPQLGAIGTQALGEVDAEPSPSGPVESLACSTCRHFAPVAVAAPFKRDDLGQCRSGPPDVQHFRHDEGIEMRYRLVDLLTPACGAYSPKS